LRITSWTEGCLLRLFRHRKDDAAQRRADVLGVAAHQSVIELDAFRAKHLGQPVERDPEAVLAHQQMGDHRRREQPALQDLLGLVDGRDLLRLGVLVHGARHDEAHGAGPAIAETEALLEKKGFQSPLALGIQELDAVFGQVFDGEVATSRRLRARQLGCRRRRRRLGWGIAGGGEVCRVGIGKRGASFGERLGVLLEFELQLGHVDPLGACHVDAATQQLVLLEEKLVDAAERVSLLRHLRQRSLGRTQRRFRRGERRPELGDPREGRIELRGLRGAASKHDVVCSRSREHCRRKLA